MLSPNSISKENRKAVRGADAEVIRRALCRDSDGRPLGPVGVALDLLAEKRES